ncbi:hypothetical protein FRB94_000416 [Tulasnella sp. JGI-2019a]|nr:hypothetical protein FRB93_009845 [Tulasnella sp. JGI-2019a]KAG9006820.1 hypothetical protein FRB94_000416 [Tulasnella sp. JGI-2019a]
MVEPATSQVPSTSPVPLGPTEPTSLPTDPAPADTAEVSIAGSSKVSITMLLVSGKRKTQEFDPKTTIGGLKEMVWSNWPTDWADEIPPSCSFLRILYLGRILTDDTILSSLNLAAPPESTVVHISIRSFAPPSDDDDGLKKKSKKRGGRRGRSGAPGTDPGSGPGEASGTARGAQADGDDTTGCCGCIIC